MSGEREAYRFAQGLITEATVNRYESLSFNRPETHALVRLPPEIRFLDGLRQLDLRQTNVSDVSVVRELTGLTVLSLVNTQVSDLSPLSGLTALTLLSLDTTQVSDLYPLSGLTALTLLSLDATQVSDLSPLSGLTALTTLSLEATPVSDLSPLSGLTALRLLSLDATQVSDLSPLSGLTALTLLRFSAAPVSDLSPLSGLTALTTLSLEATPVSDLSPLSGLTALTELWLNSTQVSDLSPLAGLTKLTGLSLDGIPARDLRPLSGLSALGHNHNALAGVFTFRNCGAALIDPRIAEIAEIEDNAERAKTLFDYLEGWVPPTDMVGSNPEPDEVFSIFAEEGRLEVAQSLPTEVERDERLKLVLHERLRAKANDLAFAAGNRFPRLATRARAVVAQVDRPFAEVDLLLLHLEVEDLSARETAGSEDGDPFPPEVTGPLSDVLRIGPGLTLGHPDVDKLNERINSARGQPVPTDQKIAHDALSRATAADAAAIGDRLRNLEGRIDHLPAEVALVLQHATHRSLLWRIGAGGLVVAGGWAEAIGVNVVSTVFHTQIVAFVQTNWPILMNAASTYGSAFAEWFAMSVSSVPDLAALSRETLERLRKRDRRN